MHATYHACHASKATDHVEYLQSRPHLLYIPAWGLSLLLLTPKNLVSNAGSTGHYCQHLAIADLFGASMTLSALVSYP